MAATTLHEFHTTKSHAQAVLRATRDLVKQPGTRVIIFVAYEEGTTSPAAGPAWIGATFGALAAT